MRAFLCCGDFVTWIYHSADRVFQFIYTYKQESRLFNKLSNDLIIICGTDLVTRIACLLYLYHSMSVQEQQITRGYYNIIIHTHNKSKDPRDVDKEEEMLHIAADLKLFYL